MNERKLITMTQLDPDYIRAVDAAWEHKENPSWNDKEAAEIMRNYGITNPENLVTKAEIAKRVGVTNPAVVNWENRFDDFPAPVIRNLYYWPQVRNFLLSRNLPAKNRANTLDDAYIKWYLSTYPETPDIKAAFTAGWNARK